MAAANTLDIDTNHNGAAILPKGVLYINVGQMDRKHANKRDKWGHIERKSVEAVRARKHVQVMIKKEGRKRNRAGERSP